MGVFGTEMNDGIGTKFCSPIEVEGDTEFAAFGKPVPMERRMVADAHLKEMGMTDTESRWDCIHSMANAIERDEPLRAMNDCYKYLDVTGCYRLMAVLCTNPIPPAPEPASYIDLVDCGTKNERENIGKTPSKTGEKP